MIYIIALLIISMPLMDDTLGTFLYFTATALWFIFRFGYELWLWARHKPRRLPALSWFLFSVLILWFGAIWTFRSICLSESTVSYILLTANILLFMTLLTIRSHPGPYPGLMLGLLGLISLIVMNHGIDLGGFENSRLANWIIMARRSNVRVFGLLAFVFIPSLLLMRMADLAVLPHLPEDTSTRKRFFRTAGRQIAFLFLFTVWCGFLVYIALSEFGAVVWLTIPALILFTWRLFAKRREIPVAKPFIVALALLTALVSIRFITINLCENPQLQAIFKCDFPVLGIQESTAAAYRAAQEHLSTGTGLGLGEEVEKSFQKVGDWRGRPGGGFWLMTIEIGCRSFLITGLFFFLLLASAVIKLFQLRKHKSGSTIILLAGSAATVSGLLFFDSRFHLLLSPLFWLTFGLLASFSAGNPLLANDRLARFIKKNQGIWVALKSFLLSLIMFALLYNGYQVLRHQFASGHVESALYLMDNSPENQAEILDLLIRASKWNPHDAHIDYLIGKTLLLGPEQSLEIKQRKRQKAEEVMKEAIEKCPLHPDCHGLLGQILFLRGEANQALKEYREAVRIAPLNSRWRAELAGLHETMGELELAERELRILCDIAPYSGSARYDLARVLERQGKIDQAIAIYKAAFLVEPDFLPARRRYVILQGM